MSSRPTSKSYPQFYFPFSIFSDTIKCIFSLSFFTSPPFFPLFLSSGRSFPLSLSLTMSSRRRSKSLSLISPKSDPEASSSSKKKLKTELNADLTPISRSSPKPSAAKTRKVKAELSVEEDDAPARFLQPHFPDSDARVRWPLRYARKVIGIFKEN